jgi:VRR-NUC domain
LGQKLTSPPHFRMSALPPKSDFAGDLRKSALCHKQTLPYEVVLYCRGSILECLADGPEAASFGVKHGQVPRGQAFWVSEAGSQVVALLQQTENLPARLAHRQDGAILKACGVRAGTPDLICFKDGRTFALELKAAGGRLSSAQEAAHEEMKAAGAEGRAPVMTCKRRCYE